MTGVGRPAGGGTKGGTHHGAIHEMGHRKMQTVKRRLLNLLTVVSLSLFVMVVVLWVRSYWQRDHIGWGFWGHDAHVPESQERWFAGIEGCSGVLAMGALREREGDPAPGPLVRTAVGFFWNDHGWPLNMFIVAAYDSAGFAFLWLNYDPTPGHLGHRGVAICVPIWFAAMISAALPLAWIGRRHRSMRRQRRQTLRLCESCGYDMRATPDRCPECGEYVEN